MTITSCSNWTSLFTLSIASSMSFLESLEVKGCDGLKHIVTNEGDNAHDHMTYSSIFPKLKEISIRKCSFLEYIFPASHCRSFNNLESVRIIGVNKLRYVFGKCYCEDNLPPHNQNVEIHLPALKILRFDDVPNLVSIGTENYHFAALSLTKFECPPSLVGAFQGIDFQTNIPPTSSTKMDDDDNDEHYEESHQEIVEYNGNLASETNYQLQVFPKVQAALPHKKLSPSQSKKEEVENELGIQMKNNNTPNLTNISKETEDSSVHGGPKLEKAITASATIELEPSNSSSTPFVFPLQNESPQDKLFGNEAKNKTVIIDQQAEAETRPDIYSNNSQNNNKVSSGEGSSLKKDKNTTSLAHSELEIASPHPLTSTKEFHEKESMGDQEALGESKQLDNTKEVDMEISNKTASASASASNPIVTWSKDTSPLNIDASPGDGSSSKKQNKPITTTKISAISSSMKPQTASATTDPEPGVSQSNEADISGNAEFPQDKIIVNQSVTDNPKQFEEDDLIRLFQIMEKSADMEVHKLYVSVEDDNKVDKALADLEISLKMGLQEIASSEENSLRLQDALSFLSTHYFEDGDPGLKPTIESLHQEIPSILSSFKQVSARLSTIDTFTKLEEKEKSVNEQFPQRKDAAISLISEIYKTEKSMAMAQQKEAELKEQISRLQDELKNKGKEIKDCETKLSFLQEEKKKSVSETIGFLEEIEAVKKDRCQIVEDKMKVRQELEKWSSCVAKWWKATLMQGIYRKHKF
ncbi:putative disease resistance protein [Senna tora]|uniref:Putative disease resistance protein n=1 Tax=Senna tora TaxID=362788 RepID=A0A834XDK8_9FABA|nr:putative disease resistance protein [Senna tora]